MRFLVAIKNIIFIIYLFFIVYMPPLLKGGMIDRVMLVISVLYTVINIKHALYVINVKENKRMLLLSLILLIYSFLISILNHAIGNNHVNYYERPISIIIFIVYFFFIATSITIYCKKNSIVSETFLKMLVIIGLIQAFFVFSSLFFPEVRVYLLNMIEENASDVKIAESLSANHFTALRRNFGFADTLYDRFGYTCSILCGISFNLGLYKEKWGYYIASLIFVFSTLLNARSGVVLCVVAILLSSIIFFINNRNSKNIIKLLSFIIVAVIAFAVALSVLEQYSPDTYEWMSIGLSSFIGDTSQVARSADGTEFYLSNETWFFPDFFGLILGTALDPYYTLGYSTDNGYVEQIWNIGIIGLLISLFLFVGSIKHTLKICSSNIERGVLYIMIALILLYMIKLFAFKNIGGTYIILGYCFLLNSLYTVDSKKA